jgi:transcriptional regulator with XRE-family HTH domain
LIDEPVDEKAASAYARRVGERLRAIRKQKGLSLQEVEAASTQEFKASVLGAYERGERSISVPRLQRLARYYNVPVDQLLPRDIDIDLTGAAEAVEGDADYGRRSAWGEGGEKVTIDLTAFERLTEPEADMLQRYLKMIQVQRQDFNGRMLTIRGDDLRAIACLFGTDADGIVRRLDDLGLRLST